MRVTTVGIVAAAAMTLTSLTVWSLTSPGEPADSRSAKRVIKPVDLKPEGSIEPASAPVAPVSPARFEDGGKTVGVEARLGHEVMASNVESSTMLYLNAKPEVDAKNSTPVNMAILIDRSGSMQGKRIENAVSAAQGMVRRLRDGDAVSVVTYNTLTDVLVPVTTIDSTTRQGVIDKISKIVVNGDTCISCALETGMEMLRQRQGMLDRMLLLSDGQATAGVRDEQGLRRLAADARKMGYSISSVGVDVNYNERIMTGVAQESNGYHYFVEDAASLPKIFDQELESLVHTVAKAAEVRVNLAPGVQLLKVYDRTFRMEGSTLVVPLGTFAATDQKTVLLKLKVPPSAAGEHKIADVRLTYQDLIKGGVGNSSGALASTFTGDPSKITTLDPLVSERVDRSETAAALKEANRLFTSGRTQAARSLIDRNRALIKDRKRSSARAVPSARRPAFDKSYERQLAALDDADQGFSKPAVIATAPASPYAAAKPAPPPAESRKGKAQVRHNAQRAYDMAF